MAIRWNGVMHWVMGFRCVWRGEGRERWVTMSHEQEREKESSSGGASARNGQSSRGGPAVLK
ncbi:MAG: hypothetical protein K9M57_11440 [Phycisphaerae bacterium]|nr:hypothetical protein [Phycisphaerae bacterium]